MSWPLPSPLPWEAETVKPVFWPTVMPTLPELECWSLVWVFVLTAASRLTLLSACRVAVSPAWTLLPWTVRSLLAPSPLAMRVDVGGQGYGFGAVGQCHFFLLQPDDVGGELGDLGGGEGKARGSLKFNEQPNC